MTGRGGADNQTKEISSMANVNIISFQLVDDAGRTGNIIIPVPATHTVAEMQAYVNTTAATLDVLTGAKINKASVSLALTLPGGLKANAVDDHPLQWGANFAFDAANTPYRYTVRVPAIDQGFVESGVVDTADPLVAAFVDDLETGDGTVGPTDRYGNDLVTLIEAAATFRKS